MWRWLFMTLGVMVLAVPLGAGGPGNDLKAMQGTWQGIVLEGSGKPPTEAEKKIKIKLVILSEKYTLYFDEMKIAEGTMKLDETKKPKTIDVTAAEGEFKGKVQPGIYQLDGDEMKVIFTEPGQERPKEFKTREKTEEMMMLYKRGKGK